MAKVNLKKGDIGETDEENEQAIAQLEKAEESVEMRVSDTSEYAARIADLEAQLAIAQANAKKAPRAATPKKSAEEIEAERAEKLVAFQRECMDRAIHIRSELVARLEVPQSLEELEALLKEYAPQVRITKSTSKRVASEGDIVAKNGIVYRPHSEWKPAHHLSDQEILNLVARANEEKAKGTLNIAALGREFDVHGAFVKGVLEGRVRSTVTGIPKPAKKV